MICAEYFDITIKILKVEHKQSVAPKLCHPTTVITTLLKCIGYYHTYFNQFPNIHPSVSMWNLFQGLQQILQFADVQVSLYKML